MEISEKERQHLMTIGEKLRNKRKELGLTQKDLYIKTGIPMKRIGEIEIGLHAGFDMNVTAKYMQEFYQDRWGNRNDE